VALEVARQLEFQYVDTGAIYRAATFAAKGRGIDWDDGDAIAALAATMDIRFSLDGDLNRVLVTVGGDSELDVTGEIRSAEISQGTSRVSAIPAVRAALLALQRRLGETSDCVLEGRDIGTVVFPAAEVKIFLTASVEERARRRWQQWSESADDPSAVPTQTEIIEQIKERDQRDSGRDVAPLKPADDAIQLDTTALSFEEVVAAIVSEVTKHPS
jgi:cytidylate kinase